MRIAVLVGVWLCPLCGSDTDPKSDVLARSKGALCSRRTSRLDRQTRRGTRNFRQHAGGRGGKGRKGKERGGSRQRNNGRPVELKQDSGWEQHEVRVEVMWRVRRVLR